MQPGIVPLWFNPERGLLACATGCGAPARAAASVMALGLDARFDLKQAFLLITGVAGADPSQASLASVVIPRYVVDGDLTHEIDAREIPPEWVDGFVPIGKSQPYEEPLKHRFNGDDGIVFELNRALVAQVIGLAADVKLEDTAPITRRRKLFEAGHGRPVVCQGDELASSIFWHGRLMSERAARWVAYQTAGIGTYALTAMEDAGILASLKSLATAGKLDWNRIVVARGVSNYDRPRVGLTAAESLAETRGSDRFGVSAGVTKCVAGRLASAARALGKWVSNPRHRRVLDTAFALLRNDEQAAGRSRCQRVWRTCGRAR